MLNRRMKFSGTPFLNILLMLCLFAVPVSAQDDNAGSLSSSETKAENGEDKRELDNVQQSIYAKYQRFNKTLTQLYGYMKETDPARAELLLRVIGKSNENRVDAQMEVLLDLLAEENPQFGGIVTRQDDLIESLRTLLDILQSEDERKRIAAEIERIQNLIKELDQVVIDQKEVRAGTERGEPTEGLEQGQSDVTDKAADLEKQMRKQDKEKQDGEQNSGESAEGKQDGQEGKQQDGESKDSDSESKPGDSESKDGQEQKPTDSQSQDSEQKPSEGSPSDSQQQQSQKGQGQQSQSQEQQQQQQEETPGREEVESAIEKMEKAIEELKEKNRDDASKEQDRAIAELEKAKAKLEEILRQLREEEKKIMLAALEARFRKMLQMEMDIRKSTGQIYEIEPEKRLPRHRARAVQLARDQSDIMLEADKALILLREDGSSVAFPEAVLEIREDMRIVTERLNEFEVDDLTVAIEDSIIEALEEMVEAFRKELEKMEEKEQQQGQPQQGQQGDPALVDLIAELKLLRSLQNRVNRRTEAFGKRIEGEQATDPEMLEMLDELSVRQARIQRATYDLATGKNQ